MVGVKKLEDERRDEVGGQPRKREVWERRIENWNKTSKSVANMHDMKKVFVYTNYTLYGIMNSGKGREKFEITFRQIWGYIKAENIIDMAWLYHCDPIRFLFLLIFIFLLQKYIDG